MHEALCTRHEARGTRHSLLTTKYMILIIDLCYKKDSLHKNEFVLPIERIVKNTGYAAQIIHYSELEKKQIDVAEKIILCGTALKDNEYIKHLDRFEWLRNVDKPVLGICAGMQVIGLIFGAKLIEALEIGITKLKVASRPEHRLWTMDYGLTVYELHNYAIEPLENFDVLAYSDVCIQAIKHKRKDIYGINFHPEVRQQKIVENFLNYR